MKKYRIVEHPQGVYKVEYEFWLSLAVPDPSGKYGAIDFTTTSLKAARKRIAEEKEKDLRDGVNRTVHEE